ncbi:hypothetical protein MMG03_001031 [Fibrobacter succinogenes]|nr:hypothetical protein [Fibrobacter succinogenes]
MTREEFAELLKKLRVENENGARPEDLDNIFQPYADRNVYIYNDACIKKILASNENLDLTTDLVNAALNLQGEERIENPTLTNPYIPGELGFKNVEPDVLLRKVHPVYCGTKPPDDIISVEVQHNGSSIFSDRLMLYVARHTSRMVPPNDMRPLDNLNLISFQLFDTYPWKVCKDYRYTIQMRTQNDLVYFSKQTITLAEVKKFLKHAEYFKDDHSRLAQWLRAIDALNREESAAFARYEKNYHRILLHKKSPTSNEAGLFQDSRNLGVLCVFNIEVEAELAFVFRNIGTITRACKQGRFKLHVNDGHFRCDVFFHFHFPIPLFDNDLLALVVICSLDSGLLVHHAALHVKPFVFVHGDFTGCGVHGADGGC